MLKVSKKWKMQIKLELENLLKIVWMRKMKRKMKKTIINKMLIIMLIIIVIIILI
jgi:hypothetical protein